MQPPPYTTAADGKPGKPEATTERDPIPSDFKMPEPIPGYEERLAELHEQEKQKAKAMQQEMIAMGWTVEEAPPSSVLEMAQGKELDELLPKLQADVPAESDEAHSKYRATMSVLETHRGFRMKKLRINSASKKLVRLISRRG